MLGHDLSGELGCDEMFCLGSQAVTKCWVSEQKGHCLAEGLDIVGCDEKTCLLMADE